MTVLLTKKRLKELYNELREKTKDFSDFTAKIFAENSRYFAVVRVALGLSSQEFAKICERTHGSIYNLERSERKIPEALCTTYLEKIMHLLPSVTRSFSQVEENYEKLYGRAKKGILLLSREEQLAFAKRGAKEALKKRKNDKNKYYKASMLGIESQQATEQERKIISLLEAKGIPFKKHAFLGGENVDILIGGNVPIAIGCKKSTNPRNLTDHARKLMYQAYRIKYNNNSVKYIAVLGNTDGTLNSKNAPLGAQILLKEICDAHYFDEELRELPKFVQNLSEVAPNGPPRR